MSDCCAHVHPATAKALSPRYRVVLWVALVLNAAMFVVEVTTGSRSGSLSLMADAVDFAADAANYGLTLVVLSMTLFWRSRAAMVKGLSMGAYGLFVLGKTLWAIYSGAPPEPLIMGVVSLLALVTNVFVALLLYTYREGDANMRSVWLCSRNDAIGNVAVAMAAMGVFGTGQAWPDLLVAGSMAVVALVAARSVVRQAWGEMAV